MVRPRGATTVSAREVLQPRDLFEDINRRADLFVGRCWLSTGSSGIFVVCLGALGRDENEDNDCSREWDDAAFTSIPRAHYTLGCRVYFFLCVPIYMYISTNACFNEIIVISLERHCRRANEAKRHVKVCSFGSWSLP